jgi:hypothetical protein
MPRRMRKCPVVNGPLSSKKTPTKLSGVFSNSDWRRPPPAAHLRAVLRFGTTIIAAETTGRSCLAIELDPAYVAVAVKRWQAFTGKEARLGASSEILAISGRPARSAGGAQPDDLAPVGTLRSRAAELNRRGLKSPRGGKWYRSSVANLFSRVEQSLL